MKLRQFFASLALLLPIRIWIVELDGRRVGIGKRDEAFEDYQALREDGENVTIHWALTTRQAFASFIGGVSP